MGSHSDTCHRAVAATALAITFLLCSAAVAGAGTRLYTGSIQIRLHSGSGSSYSIPFGADVSYPKMNNLPSGDLATTLGKAPASIRLKPNQMTLETSAFTYLPTRLGYRSFVSSYFSGGNDAASFSAGGAPGSAMSTPVTSTPSGSQFRVSFSGTPTQFGGTMRLLADFYAQYGHWDRVRLPLGAIGGSFGNKQTATGYMGGTFTPPTFFVESVWGFPWTTGTVVAKAPRNPSAGGPSATVSLTAMGSDLRTPQGDGKMQLVTPFVVRMHEPGNGARLGGNAGVAVVSLQFGPEPSVIAQLAAGLLGLSALYRFSRRKKETRTDG
jgi:hypothetical protein